MNDRRPQLDDYNWVSQQYHDWNRRERSTTNPLTPRERIAYLVVDYWIRLDMGGYDGLLDDGGIETVAALRSVNLMVQAHALQQALSNPTESARERALSELAYSNPGTFPELLNNAVAAFLREGERND